MSLLNTSDAVTLSPVIGKQDMNSLVTIWPDGQPKSTPL